MKRRDFIKTSAKGSAVAGISTVGSSFLSSCINSKSSSGTISVFIPLPIQVVIDDVGWWSGKNGSEDQEPFRTGINRNHVVADYQAIIDLGKALNIRPQAAMVIGEWDRQNILKHLPHSTWMGKNWDNSKWVGSWLDEAADLIKSNTDHFEISIHGLVHEWWENGIASRAEWAEEMTGIMRPKEEVEKHLTAYGEILKQNNLDSLFPTTFVPTNFCHTFGVSAGRDISMAQILRNYGFTYINTDFQWRFHGIEKVQYGNFGVDSGILTVDRGADLVRWNNIGVMPKGEIKSQTVGMHWPNLLHENPERNSEIVEGWVNLLKPYNEKQDTMLAKDSIAFQKQIVHHSGTKIKQSNDEINLDFSDTVNMGTIMNNDELTIKVSSEKELKFTSQNIEIVSVSKLNVERKFLYTLSLKKKENIRAAIKFNS